MTHPVSTVKNINDGLGKKTERETVDFYDKWADNYEQDMSIAANFKGWQGIGELLEKRCPDKNVKIIDICAGTGLLGEQLAKRGYKNLDAHDGSESMLDKAKLKKVYQNFRPELIQPGIQNQVMPNDYYDIVVGSAIFGPGHLNSSHLDNIIQPLKKEGLLIFSINEAWLAYPEKSHPDWKYEMEKAFQDFESAGKWKQLDKIRTKGYLHDMDGWVFCFQKLLGTDYTD